MLALISAIRLDVEQDYEFLRGCGAVDIDYQAACFRRRRKIYHAEIVAWIVLAQAAKRERVEVCEAPDFYIALKLAKGRFKIGKLYGAREYGQVCATA